MSISARATIRKQKYRDTIEPAIWYETSLDDVHANIEKKPLSKELWLALQNKRSQHLSDNTSYFCFTVKGRTLNFKYFDLHSIDIHWIHSIFRRTKWTNGFFYPYSNLKLTFQCKFSFCGNRYQPIKDFK